MAIKTKLERIDLAKEADLQNAIVDCCDIMAARVKPMRLAASFESGNQLILIFQSDS